MRSKPTRCGARVRPGVPAACRASQRWLLPPYLLHLSPCTSLLSPSPTALPHIKEGECL